MRRTSDRDAVLRELEGSGLSMAEFCRRHGLGYSTVAAWRAARRRRKEAGMSFVELVTEAPSSLPPELADAGRSPARDELPPPERCMQRPPLLAELALPGGAVLRVCQVAQEGGAA